MKLDQIREGDPEALRLLLGSTWHPLVLYLATYLDSIEAAEDAAQEAFVRLWAHRERWTSGSAKAVLFRIGRNLAFDVRRKVATRRRWEHSRPPDASPSPATPEEVLVETELMASFREAVESLPTRRREVFELIRLRGLSHGEAAEVLGLSYRTVANHLRMAMRDIKHMMAESPADDREGHVAEAESRPRNGKSHG